MYMMMTTVWMMYGETARDPAHPTGVDASLTAELLRRSWLFAQLDPEQVDRLATSVRCLRFGSGDTIVGEGEEGDALFQVVDGEVEVFWEGPRRWYKATVTDIVRDVGRRWAVLVEYEDMSEAYHFFDDGSAPRTSSRPATCTT